jgi:hypothetical protein
LIQTKRKLLLNKTPKKVEKPEVVKEAVRKRKVAARSKAVLSRGNSC